MAAAALPGWQAASRRALRRCCCLFVLFCFVLFCFVLFCLFCFVLFCFVLFCFVLFCFVLFCFVLFCFVLFCFVLFCFVLFCFVLFCFVLFCFVCLFVCLFVVVSESTGARRMSMSTSPVLNGKGASMAKNSSPSRAPKTGAQLRDNPEERNKWPKRPKNPSNRLAAINTAIGLQVEIMSRFPVRTARGPPKHLHVENMKFFQKPVD